MAFFPLFTFNTSSCRMKYFHILLLFVVIVVFVIVTIVVTIVIVTIVVIVIVTIVTGGKVIPQMGVGGKYRERVILAMYYMTHFITLLTFLQYFFWIKLFAL